MTPFERSIKGKTSPIIEDRHVLIPNKQKNFPFNFSSQPTNL